MTITSILEKIISYTEKTVDYIGYNSAVILVIFTGYVLKNQLPYLIGYFSFFAFNILINKLIKNFIQQPRPKNPIHYSDNEIYTNAEQYGMPSGHVQLAVFSVMYLYMVKRNILWAFMGIFLCAITFYQRWKYRRHTVEQLIAGGIIGTLIGYFAYNTINQYLSKRMV